MFKHPVRPRPRVFRVLLLLVIFATACSSAARGTPGTPPASPVGAGELTLVAPLTLSRRDTAQGETIIGSVTYANTTTAPIAIRNLIIAARTPSGGPNKGTSPSFSPGYGAATVVPGQRITLIATYVGADGQLPGTWQAFSSYQDDDGTWHAAPPENDVAFEVAPPAASAGTPAAVAPTSTPTTTPTPQGTAIPTAQAVTPSPTIVPQGQVLETPTPLYWGAYIDGVPWDFAPLDAFEARAGKPVSIIHWGQAWWNNGQYQPFYASDFDRVRSRGAIPLLDWGSWDYCCGPDQPQFSLAAIARGDHDAYIRQWATAARDWGHPLFLRFDHEMNGWWQFPWSARLNGNQPGDYIRAWRHVHDLFVAVGATNVTWVWCPNVVSAQTTPIDQLYPGDAYVDWVAMDGYNWGTDYGNTWQSFASIFGETYAALRKLAPGKPIMIAEIGCSERGGDKAAWIRDALGVQLPTKFPAIKAVVWFNWNDNDPTLTGNIESSPASIAAFGGTIGGSTQYLPNRFGNFNTTPIPPVAP